MFRRRRPLARAAVVGGVAHTAAKAGAKAGAEAQQTAPPDAHEQVPPAAAPSKDESIKELKELKGLLDSGVLTQAEFDARKRRSSGTCEAR
jgi:hypothetical protein